MIDIKIMNKKLTYNKRLSKILLVVLALFSTSVLAHSGHLINESVHSQLHVEHIVALSVLGIVAYIAHVYGNK